MDATFSEWRNRQRIEPANQISRLMFNWFFILLYVGLTLPSAGHALLFKKDPRSALGWITICLMFPLAGPILYFLFGINRIRTRARKLQLDSPFRIRAQNVEWQHALAVQIPPSLTEIARMSNALVRRPLIRGNRIEPLYNGEAAYPAMMEAIDAAERFVYLTTYIFETNASGEQFIDALTRAKDRGVDVRVIIDGVGEWYSLPRAGSLLQDRGVRVVRFLPPKLFPPTLRINLRNHRKIMVADGRVGFLGGMNIGDRHLADKTDNPGRVIDLHFRLTGPIVTQIEQVFLEDWRFCTRETTQPRPTPPPDAGNTICRAIVDGPNEDIDRIYMILLCAFSSAQNHISIMTPYFLPPAELIAALQAAALRGVAVNILLPEKNNHPIVQWASVNLLPELLIRGVRVFYQPPPFVHTKLFIVDNHYAQVGSANLDIRSLRLNFELMVELYGATVSEILTPHFQEQLNRSREVPLEEVEGRSLPVKVRDALSWIFSPYL